MFQELGNAAGTTAWMEGWAMPVEKAVKEALNKDAGAVLKLGAWSN
jgi:hypothetical protein